MPQEPDRHLESTASAAAHASVRSGLRPLALTMGDPAGIGLEITLQAWRERQTRAIPPFVLYGDPDSLADRARAIGLSPGSITIVDHPAAALDVFGEYLPVSPVRLARKARPGVSDPANAAAIAGAIEQAVQAVIKGDAGAVVTNPIHKATLLSAGFAHPGHTEFLGALAERYLGGRRCHPVMMLACDELRVVPLTVHIPLADVPRALTRSLLFGTIRTTWSALRDDFGIASPRIAVSGLNPHAGESGLMGREEEETIRPAIEALRAEGLTVTGPHAADTLFHAGARANYDAVIAMYHDQALIPIKTLAFDRGVNVTLGLPFVRTSPDHGTAFDIAGRGVASPLSLIESLKLAQKIADARLAAARVTR